MGRLTQCDQCGLRYPLSELYCFECGRLSLDEDQLGEEVYDTPSIAELLQAVKDNLL